MESNFLQSQWVQRRGLLLADTWRLNPKFKPTTRRSLEYEALRGTPSWQAEQKQSPTPHCSLHVSCWERSCLESSLQARKNSRISMGEDLPKHIKEIRKNVLIPAMKKIKQETPSHKATVIGDKLVVNGKVYFHYDVPKKWLPVNSSVNTHEDYGNGTAEHQEESSDVMVQFQELLSQSE